MSLQRLSTIENKGQKNNYNLELHSYIFLRHASDTYFLFQRFLGHVMARHQAKYIRNVNQFSDKFLNKICKKKKKNRLPSKKKKDAKKGTCFSPLASFSILACPQVSEYSFSVNMCCNIFPKFLKTSLVSLKFNSGGLP